MIQTNLEWKTLGIMLAVSALIVSVDGRTIEARPQAVASVPVLSNDPAVQRRIENTLAPARLDPLAHVRNLDIANKPLKQVIDAIASAGGITVRYASDITSLDTPSSVAVSDETVEEALRGVLNSAALTFEAAGKTMAFIYPDTAANREKYTVLNQVFTIRKADPVVLASQLNRALRLPREVFQPLIVSVRDSREIVVRARPEVLSLAAAWITENDKEQ